MHNFIDNCSYLYFSICVPLCNNCIYMTYYVSQSRCSQLTLLIVNDLATQIGKQSSNQQLLYINNVARYLLYVVPIQLATVRIYSFILASQLATIYQKSGHISPNAQVQQFHQCFISTNFHTICMAFIFPELCSQLLQLCTFQTYIQIYCQLAMYQYDCIMEY